METETPTPTLTPEPTPTPTATLNFYVEMETPGGEAARLERTITAGDSAVVVMLALILASLWAMYVASLFRDNRMKRSKTGGGFGTGIGG